MHVLRPLPASHTDVNHPTYNAYIHAYTASLPSGYYLQTMWRQATNHTEREALTPPQAHTGHPVDFEPPSKGIDHLEICGLKGVGLHCSWQCRHKDLCCSLAAILSPLEVFQVGMLFAGAVSNGQRLNFETYFFVFSVFRDEHTNIHTHGASHIP